MTNTTSIKVPGVTVERRHKGSYVASVGAVSGYGTTAVKAKVALVENLLGIAANPTPSVRPIMSGGFVVAHAHESHPRSVVLGVYRPGSVRSSGIMVRELMAGETLREAADVHSEAVSV